MSMTTNAKIAESMATDRPGLTVYLSNDFYKAALQWLAAKDERSMAWLAGKWLEANIDKAISNGEIPADVVDKLRAELQESA